jgi:hypothetical protein
MRIVIEIDGKETGATKEPQQPMAEEPAAGGAGPGGDGPSVTGPELDSGGPPQSLVDAIAAAEVAGIGGAGDQAGATDAGAAPSGF